MTIAKRQLSQIQNILREGSDEIIQAQKIRKVLLDESLERYDNEKFNSIAIEVVDEDGQDLALNLLTQFNPKLFYRLAAFSNGTKMFTYKHHGKQLRNDIEYFDADGLMELKREFATDVSAALEKYALEISELVAHMAEGESSQGEMSDYVPGYGSDDTDTV
jgi:hypothetical protein